MGEIVAGIVLGPSLLGYFFPEFSAALFPPESLMNLNLLSQIGLVLFMFVIGLELDFSVIKDKLNETLVISQDVYKRQRVFASQYAEWKKYSDKIVFR